MNEEDLDVSLDRIFECLADPDRRSIISALRDSESIEFTALAELSHNPDHYHVHLPKLEEAQLIDWDREREVVERGPVFEVFRPCLRTIEDKVNDLPHEW